MAFRPCAEEAFLEQRLEPSSGIGALAAVLEATTNQIAPLGVSPAGAGLAGTDVGIGLTGTGVVAGSGNAIGSTGTDVVSIGTTLITGAITGSNSQASSSISYTSFQAASNLADVPQIALNIPGTTPVNLPTGPLPGVLGTPESVIGYWGYNDGFGNGYYQYVSSTMDSTPFFNNPNEGFHLLTESAPSKSSDPSPTGQGAGVGASPDAFGLGMASAGFGGTGIFAASPRGMGNSALGKSIVSGTSLRITRARPRGFGSVDLPVPPWPGGAKGTGGPITPPSRASIKSDDVKAAARGKGEEGTGAGGSSDKDSSRDQNNGTAERANAGNGDAGPTAGGNVAPGPAPP